MLFKITFNKPAHDHFFKGQEVGGIEIALANGKVRFKPVAQFKGNSIVSVTERARGGVETRLIEGGETDNLFKALTNPLGYPFYMLERVNDGWVEATPWDGPKKLTGDPAKDLKAVPDRFTPHLRVWPKGNARTGDPILDEVTDDFPEIDAAVVSENSVRDKLRQISDALGDINTLPLGRALTRLKQAKELIEATEGPLFHAARIQAAALLGQIDEADEGAEPETEAAHADAAPDAVKTGQPAARRPSRMPPRLAARLGSNRSAHMAGARG